MVISRVISLVVVGLAQGRVLVVTMQGGLGLRNLMRKPIDSHFLSCYGLASIRMLDARLSLRIVVFLIHDDILNLV